jgi:hypothetical protein
MISRLDRVSSKKDLTLDLIISDDNIISAAAGLVRTSLIFVVGKQKSNAGSQGNDIDKTRGTSL